MALLINPILYSVGISLIIVVLSYDIDSIMDVIGRGRSHKLSPHITYSRELQEISLLMGTGKYSEARKKAEWLVSSEPTFAMAHNLLGEILLEGFQAKKKARESFDRAIELSTPGDEQHRIAETLRASTYEAN